MILLAVGGLILMEPKDSYLECLENTEISEYDSLDTFYVEFDTKIKEEEIIDLIDKSNLSTDSLSIRWDIYSILSTNSEILIDLFNSTQEIISVENNGNWVVAEFYKNITPNESEEIINKIIEDNNITVYNDRFSFLQFRERRSAAYIEIPEKVEKTVIEFVCEFREIEIVESANIFSLRVYASVG